MRKPLLVPAVLTLALLIVVAAAFIWLWPGVQGDFSRLFASAQTGPQTLPVACQAPVTRVHEVQGVGKRSPLVGETITVQGVVVSDFQTTGDNPFNFDLGGYHIQELHPDNDPQTSEGIFIHDSKTDVQVGNLVRVTGRVTEFNNLTELTRLSETVVCSTSAPLPEPTAITLPLESVDSLEAYEGMLVTFPQQLVIAEYHNFDRYGEVLLALAGEDGARPMQPTAVLSPTDSRLPTLQQARPLAQIMLDDGRTQQNPHPPIHPNGREFTASNSFRGGDLVEGLTAVLYQSNEGYRLQPIGENLVVSGNPRPAAPADVGGHLRVGSFNVLNYFTTLRSGNARCGPLISEECRGADTRQEFERQRSKIVAALRTMNADVVGLLEIENDPEEAAVADLVGALNASAIGAADQEYAAIEFGGPVGSDTIRVALIYQPGKVKAVGSTALLDAPAFVDPTNAGEDRNRAALTQAFEDLVSGEQFVVSVLHLKSKGSNCGGRDDDRVQGNCTGTRVAAARALLEWLDTDPTGIGTAHTLLLGDFNAYDKEDPISAVIAGSDGRVGTADDFHDLLARFEGEHAYTYVFDGQLGYLDYVFASDSLLEHVTGATAWHINADEPDILDYDMSFKPAAQAALFSADAYRSSDHDPVVIGLSFK